MNVTVLPSVIKGCVEAIPSKSLAHRLLICAALSENDKTEIVCQSISEDIKATMSCLASLGGGMTYENGIISVSPLACLRYGATLNCRESGSTYRFLVPVTAALGVEPVFLLEGRLGQRPMQPLWKTLENNGVSISGKGTDKVRISGKLSCGEYYIPGNITSQFISGLLMALPLLENDSIIHITGCLESKGYLDMTLSAMKTFGVRAEVTGSSAVIFGKQTYTSPRRVLTEGDWSNAAFWLCGAAACGQSLTCTGLNPLSSQGDRAICRVLEDMGAKTAFGKNLVTVKANGLHGTDVDAKNIPDLVPAIAVAACSARGTTKIYNAGRLRLKESDRLFTVADTLSRLGADISEQESSLVINGGKTLAGGCVDSCGDHRIVMMASIASVISTGSITIRNAEAVNKSYPGFFDAFENLNGCIRKE